MPRGRLLPCTCMVTIVLSSSELGRGCPSIGVHALLVCLKISLLLFSRPALWVSEPCSFSIIVREILQPDWKHTDRQISVNEFRAEVWTRQRADYEKQWSHPSLTEEGSPTRTEFLLIWAEEFLRYGQSGWELTWHCLSQGHIHNDGFSVVFWRCGQRTE